MSLAARWVRSLVGLRCCALLALSSGCRSTPSGVRAQSGAAPSPAVVSVPAPIASDALELARRLPGGADRCSVAQPMLLPPEQRALAGLISQTEKLPWSSRLPVLAYARAERSPGRGLRAVVELLRVDTRDRRAVQAELSRLLDRPIQWRDATSADPCAGESTCTALQGQFLEPSLAHPGARFEPQTVLLTYGEWPAGEAAESSCLTALYAHPEALELSARSALLTGTELRDSQARLERSPTGLTRITARNYAEATAAERALREARHGHDELPFLVGVPADSLGTRAGAVLTQSISVSFAELALARDDQLRESAARERDRTPSALALLDPHDADAVRATYDAQLVQLRAHPEPAALARLAALLEQACALSPDDDGLARRRYQLELSLRNDPRAAAEVATAALARGLGERNAWLLHKRAALVRFDPLTLRSELQKAFALPVDAAARMSRELESKRAHGDDYERSEWAFLTARKLAAAVRKSTLRASSQRLPVRELSRLFAYLGQSERPQHDLGVHVLVYGAHRGQTPGGLWSADTAGAGRSGVVYAATSWDDTLLRALGASLAEQLDEGPFELLLGLEGIGNEHHVALAFAGQRRGDELWLESVSRPVQALSWSALERLLLAPLTSLVGATYPPDELSIRALDAAEASQLLRAAETAPGVKCVIDGASLRCHGALSDASAARRALLAVAHEKLAREAHTLWSGLD